MDEHTGQTRQPACPDFPVDTLAEVNDARPDGEAPAQIAKAVLGVVERERGLVVRLCAIADEAAGGVGVDANHEEEGEVVGVPERLEALLADLVVRGRVHEDHDCEQEVTRDTTGLGVVDVERPLWPNLWGRLSASLLCHASRSPGDMDVRVPSTLMKLT